MKKVQLSILAFLGSISVAAFSNAHAETRANSMTFTVGGGKYFFASKRNLENTGVLFGTIGYNFTENWGVEGLIGSLHTESEDPANFARKSVSGNLYAVDGVYHFTMPYPFVEPYVLFGVGMTGLSPNYNDANDEGNINGGLGLQFFARPSLFFRVEARDFYTIVGGKNDVFIDGSVGFAVDFC